MKFVIMAFKFKALAANSSDFKIPVKLWNMPFITGNFFIDSSSMHDFTWNYSLFPTFLFAFIITLICWKLDLLILFLGFYQYPQSQF